MKFLMTSPQMITLKLPKTSMTNTLIVKNKQQTIIKVPNITKLKINI